MRNHEIEGVGARLLAERRIEHDIAPEQRLERRADITDYAAGAYHDPAHETEVAHDPVAGEVVRGRNQQGRLLSAPIAIEAAN
jgi:hypothetical protein